MVKNMIEKEKKGLTRLLRVDHFWYFTDVRFIQHRLLDDSNNTGWRI